MIKTVVLFLVLLAVGGALAVAQWLTGASTVDQYEETVWVAPPLPRPAPQSVAGFVDALGEHAVFAVKPAAAKDAGGAPAAKEPQLFPKIISIAILGGKTRAFLLGPEGERVTVAKGEEILGWTIKSIDMKGLMIERDGVALTLGLFGQTEVPGSGG